MRALRGVFMLVLAVTLPAPVLAADFQAGLEAYERGDFATAWEEWRPLAEQGNVDAQFNLGLMYEKGRGVPQDYAEAVKWYHLAAAQGDADAQVNLGAKYNYGLGVPQDYAEAIKWYHLAAAQGNASAQRDLGIMYAEGRGVIKDYAQAHMWFSLAAARAPPGAARDAATSNRDTVEQLMTPAQVAEAQRLARQWKPK